MEDSLVIKQDISANELQVYEICACFWGEFYFSNIYIATRDQVDTKPNLGKNVSLTEEYVKDVRAVAHSIKSDQKAYFGTLKKLFNFYHDSRYIYANSFVAFINEFIKSFIPDDIYSHMFQGQKDIVLRRIINRIVEETAKNVLLPETLHLIIDNRNTLSTKRLKDKFIILIINIRNELHREFISGDATLTVEKQISQMRNRLCDSERIIKKITKKYKELKLEYMDLEEDYNRLKSKIKHSASKDDLSDSSISDGSDNSDGSDSEYSDDAKSKKSSVSKRSSKSSNSKKSNQPKKKMDSIKILNNKDPNDVLKKRELAETTASKANNKISNIKIKSFDTKSVASGKSTRSNESKISRIGIVKDETKVEDSIKNNPVESSSYLAPLLIKKQPIETEQTVEIPNSRLSIGGKKLTINKTLPPDHVLDLKNPINPLSKPVHTMFKQSSEVQETPVTYNKPPSMMSFNSIEDDENSVLG
jgi:hypothetical protein